jgi:hypothetical protein
MPSHSLIVCEGVNVYIQSFCPSTRTIFHLIVLTIIYIASFFPLSFLSPWIQSLRFLKFTSPFDIPFPRKHGSTSSRFAPCPLDLYIRHSNCATNISFRLHRSSQKLCCSRRQLCSWSWLGIFLEQLQRRF